MRDEEAQGILGPSLMTLRPHTAILAQDKPGFTNLTNISTDSTGEHYEPIL